MGSHLQSAAHKKAIVLQFRFDYLTGVPTMPKKDDGDLKKAYRGSLRGQRVFPEKEPRGCPNPISQEKLEAFWGKRFGLFGIMLHGRLAKEAYITIDVGRKHMKVPTAHIVSVDVGAVQHSHRVIT